MTTNPKIPIDETTKVITFNSPFLLNNAVKNEPNNNMITNTISHESGKDFKTCGKIKPKTIHITNNINEIKLKYLLITSTSL